MSWKIEFERGAEKDFGKLPRNVQSRIIRFLLERVAPMENPRTIGEALKGTTLGEFWKFRVGDYRLITSIQDETVTILVVRVGNRKEIYK